MYTINCHALHTDLAYLVALASQITGLGLENAGLEPIFVPHWNLSRSAADHHSVSLEYWHYLNRGTAMRAGPRGP